MESCGEELKKIRLEKGLSLEDVHKKTKIHLKILNAIEEDNLVSVSPVYIKGFLKIYCQFLGLDHNKYTSGLSDPAVKYKSAIPGSATKPMLHSKQFSLHLGVLSRIFQRIPVKKILVIVLGLALIFGIFKLGKDLTVKRGLAKKNKVVSAVVQPRTENKEVIKPQSIKAQDFIRLDIKANENCWLDLKADGKAMFRSVLKKGKAESWQAKNKIELSLGNAGVVDLEVNGKRISALGRKGQAVKNIIITKEGLTVKR